MANNVLETIEIFLQGRCYHYVILSLEISKPPIATYTYTHTVLPHTLTLSLPLTDTHTHTHQIEFF